MRKYPIAALTLTLMTTLTCCEEKPVEINPLLTRWDTPYGIPPFDRIRAEHYKPAVEEGIARHKAEIAAIVADPSAPTFENVIAALDRSGRLLADTYLTFSLTAAADNNDTLQRIDMEISPLVASHDDDIYMNEKLFDKVETVYEARHTSSLTPEQIRLTERTYDRFVRAGARLTPRKKEELRRINEELTELGIRFGNNLLAENRDFALVLDTLPDTNGLPEDVIDAAAAEAKARGMKGKWVFTLSKPSFIPFMTYAERRDLRERLYKGYLSRGDNGNENDNKQIVADIVRLRTEKAHLLDYPSYAAFVLDDKIAGNPENVYALLDKLWGPALGLASRELDEMRAIKARETLGDSTFAAWDWWYYAEKVRKERYDLDEEMLKPYFSLENVRTGAFRLANRLWGLTFRPVSVPLYHEECMAYEVLDKDESHLGILIFDFFPRPGKQAGAWCGAYRDEHYDTDGQRVAPIVTIVCNFTRPNGNMPALLDLDQTQTLFHEFGHALHNLLARNRYIGTGMDKVERDFVELPSQIMENWAVEPQMLKSYAKHYQTGEIIPEHLIRKIRNSRYFNQGFATTELLAAALIDMDIHSTEEYTPIDLTAFEHEALYGKRGLMPQIAPRYRYPYFAHIFNGDGYSAGYYSYIWAEVLDKDAFRAFVDSGDIFDPELAKSYRKHILERGSSQDGMTLFRNFRGKDPDPTALMIARGLIETPTDSTEKAALETETQTVAARPGMPLLPDE